MTEIILVRHGQANSQADSEESYDQLSGLGATQAGWLGEHLRGTNGHFDHIVTGTLKRHVQTADAMGHRVAVRDPRWNELQYWVMAEALEAEHGVPRPGGPEEFAQHFPVTLDHWSRDRLSAVPERHEEFSDRISDAVQDLCGAHGRALVITSGGVIGMVVRQILGLDTDATAKMILQIMNSSMHKLTFTRGHVHLSTFNATPHLDHPDRAHARTFV